MSRTSLQIYLNSTARTNMTEKLHAATNKQAKTKQKKKKKTPRRIKKISVTLRHQNHCKSKQIMMMGTTTTQVV